MISETETEDLTLRVIYRRAQSSHCENVQLSLLLDLWFLSILFPEDECC